MGDLFSKWEALTLIEIKSGVQKSILFLSASCGKDRPQAYNCRTSFQHYLGLDSQDLESFLLLKLTMRLGVELQAVLQDLTRTSTVSNGTSRRNSRSSLAQG